MTRAPERRRTEQEPTPGARGSGLFDGYLEPDRPYAGAFDEMFHADGRVRSHYRALHDAIAPTAAADLAVRSEAPTSTRASRSRCPDRNGRSRSTSCPG